MSKPEPITSESNDAPVFRSELSDNPSSSASAIGSNVISSLTKLVGDEKIQQSSELLRKGIEIQHSELTYDEKKPIGRGAYGQVFKGSFRKEDVAIKIYDFKGVLSSEEKQNMLLEAQTMDQLRSKYLVGLRGVFFEPHYGLVMEFCAGGTLSQILKQSDIPLDFAQQLQWGMEISYGLHALHTVRIFHRDLKGDNILLTETRQAKIGDFGLAQIKSASATQSKHIENSAAGTIPWMAPELFDKKPHTAAADMYSLGMVLWEIVSRQSPFHGVMPFVIIGTVLAGKRETIPQQCPRIFQELITACWDADPFKRPTAEKVGEEFEAAWRSISGLPAQISELKQKPLKITESLTSTIIVPQIKREATLEERSLMLWSVSQGDKNALEGYLKSGITPDLLNEEGQPLLYLAITKKQDSLVKLLLDYRANVNNASSSPLHAAIDSVNVNVVRLLLAYNADVELVWKSFTPLTWTIDCRQKYYEWKEQETILTLKNLYQIVNVLLENKADVNKYTKNDWDSYWDKYRFPLSMCMLKMGMTKRDYDTGTPGSDKGGFYAATAQLLLERKADIFSLPTDSYRFNAIGFALNIHSQQGTGMVKIFLESKLDINQKVTYYIDNREEMNILGLAAMHGYPPTVKLLINSKADVNFINTLGKTPIFYAVGEGLYENSNFGRYDDDLYLKNREVFNLLLESNADLSIKAKKIEIRSSLSKVNIHNNCTVLNYLNELYKVMHEKHVGNKGSKKYVNIANPGRDNSDLLAAYYRIEMATKSLKLIINLLEVHEKKQTQQSVTLFSAIDKGDYQLTKNALESKTIVNRTDNEGRSPLFVAAQKGLTQIVKLLLEYHAKVDQAKQPGLTALATAAFRDHLEVVRILLEAKADPTVKSVSGETPQQVALRHGHHAVAALFQPRPSSGQESWRETKYETSAITSSTGSTTQSDIPPITDIKESSSSSMSSSITASSSSSTFASVSSPATSSGTSTQTVSEIKSSITETPGTLFSINQPKSSDSELRQPLIPKPPKPENSSRCCLIM